MRVRGYLGERGSTVNRSIARIAGAVKLTEIVIYDRSAVQYNQGLIEPSIQGVVPPEVLEH